MEITKISPLLKKKVWKRLVTQDADIPPMIGADYYDVPVQMTFNGLRYQYLTEFDLMQESSEGAHEINSKYMSKRPIYDVETRVVDVPVADANGNPVLDANGNQVVEHKEIKDWYENNLEDIDENDDNILSPI